MIKSFKDLKAGDVVRTLPLTRIEGPFQLLDVFIGGNYTSAIALSATGLMTRCDVAGDIETIDRPSTDFEALKRKYWNTVVPASGYKTMNGTDPEIFVVDAKDQVIPAWEFLPSKDQLKLLGYGAPYWDGVQAEFSVMASHCLNSQNDFTMTGLQRVIMSAREKFPDAKLSMRNVIEVPPKILESAKDEHVALGCAPSLNAYGLQGIEVPNPRLLRHRFAGGHIHKQWPLLTAQRGVQVVKAVDALLAVPCVTMFQKLDDPIRRKFYGLPGEYRLPKHGLEYRVLSNAWLCHPAIAQFVRETFRLVTGLAKINAENVFDYREEEVVSIILNHDVDGARKFVKRNLDNYKKLYGMVGHWIGKPTTKGLALLQSSVTDLVDPLKIEQNWSFDSWRNNCGLPGTTWGGFANL